MDFLSLLSDTAWITAIGTIIGSAVTYFVTKANNRKDLSINDRMQLSKDQYQLIAELRQLMQEQRDEIDSLKEEMKELQSINIRLMIENKELQQNIAELNIILSNFSSK